MNIYNNIDILPIYNFNKCFKGDLKYMFKDLNFIDSPVVKTQWNKLYNEYCKLTYNNTTLKYYRLVGELKFLENREIYVPVLLDLLTKTPKDDRGDIITELRKWKISVNKNTDLNKLFEVSIKVLNNSKNTYNRKLAELEAMNNKPKEVLSLQQQKAKLHKLLGINIDLHTTSVSEWLAYWEEVKTLKQNDGE